MTKVAQSIIFGIVVIGYHQDWWVFYGLFNCVTLTVTSISTHGPWPVVFLMGSIPGVHAWYWQTARGHAGEVISLRPYIIHTGTTST